MNAPITKPSEALRAARELLTPEGAWIQNDFARDVTGHTVGFKDRRAVCFCSRGAIYTQDGPVIVKDIAEQHLEAVVGSSNVAVWNDSDDRTHAEVLAAFDRALAIALAEEAGQ